jgi:hypothetical protein
MEQTTKPRCACAEAAQSGKEHPDYVTQRVGEPVPEGNNELESDPANLAELRETSAGIHPARSTLLERKRLFVTPSTILGSARLRWLPEESGRRAFVADRVRKKKHEVNDPMTAFTKKLKICAVDYRRGVNVRIHRDTKSKGP